MTQEANLFAVGAGRERPKYTPKALQCINCGASVKLFSEQAVQAVCDACGSMLDLSKEEQVVCGLVSKNRVRGLQFPLLTEFVFESRTYRVTARLVYKDGWGALSYDYLLFNPFFGSFWLSSYKNDFTTSRVSHVMPCTDPFALSDGKKLTTHDKKVWIRLEQGKQELVYVDGALPWHAKIGDTHEYVELQSKTHPKVFFEVEREATKDGAEMEFAISREISLFELKSALKDKSLMDFLGPIKAPESKTPAWILAGVSLLAALGFFLALFSSSSRQIAEVHFSPTELNNETLSSTFRVDDVRFPVEIEMYSSVDNAWMYLTWAIVESSENMPTKQTYEEVAGGARNDKMVHIGEAELSYYHGYEGGESWSEGSQSDTLYVLFPKPGTYRLMAKAVSGTRESEDVAKHSISFFIYENARLDRYYLFMLFLSLSLVYVSRIKIKDFKLDDFISDDD